MPLSKMESIVDNELKRLAKEGVLKGEELVIEEIKKAKGDKGPRYIIQGQGEKEFIRMNSNSYLGMSLRQEVIAAEEEAVKEFGVGPGAVRFINGTYSYHIKLEEKLAEFHGKDAGMIFSSAYSANCGILAPLISGDTVVISDQLNHNSIINAIRLSKPKDKEIYQHLNYMDLELKIKEWIGRCKRIIIITDGVFSMRGDYANLSSIVELSKEYDHQFEEGILTVVDDSHGIGAFGKTGRGTPEVSGGEDIYVVTTAKIIEYLRETSPFYIYSNPITPSEASAVLKALEILDSARGMELLKGLREKRDYFESGLTESGYEVLKGEHPIVPLMVRDTQETKKIVNFLKEHGILVVGLKYPVVPEGDESLRFQISADHTIHDIDYVLNVLKEYK